MTVLQFPEVRAEGAPASPEAQVPAPARARTREPRKLRLPPARVLAGVLQGGSLLATAAPAVLTVWAEHQQAAGYYRRWFARYPRLAYGAGHAFIETPLAYLWLWSGRSPVLRAFLAVMVLIILRLLGVHVLWSWL